MANISTSNSNKTFLRIAVEEWNPWTIVEQTPHGLEVRGIAGKMFHVLADKLHFDYELVRPPDRTWGLPDEHGNWTGMFGMLQRQDVEFSIGPMGVSLTRASVCDFTIPIYSEDQFIIMTRPKPENDIKGFIKPFDLTVWLLIMMGMVAVGIAHAAILRKEERLFKTNYRSKMSSTVLWLIKAITQEGSEWLPSTDGARIVVATWIFVSLVIASSYSGILVGMLMIPKVNIPIDSVEDLVSQNKLEYQIENGFMVQYYKEAKGGLRKQVWDGLDGISDKFCWGARKDIVHGKYAMICDTLTMHKAISWDFSTSGACHLYISKYPAYTNSHLSMAWKVNSTYREKADKIISRVKESGLLAKWISEELHNTTFCLRSPIHDRELGIQPINIHSIIGPLIVLVSGLSLALLVFIMELVMLKLGKRSKIIQSITFSY